MYQIYDFSNFANKGEKTDVLIKELTIPND